MSERICRRNGVEYNSLKMLIVENVAFSWFRHNIAIKWYLLSTMLNQQRTHFHIHRHFKPNEARKKELTQSNCCSRVNQKPIAKNRQTNE